MGVFGYGKGQESVEKLMNSNGDDRENKLLVVVYSYFLFWVAIPMFENGEKQALFGT